MVLDKGDCLETLTIKAIMGTDLISQQRFRFDKVARKGNQVNKRIKLQQSFKRENLFTVENRS